MSSESSPPVDPFQVHFDVIKRLYEDEDKTAKETQKFLETHHGFPAIKYYATQRCRIQQIVYGVELTYIPGPRHS